MNTWMQKREHLILDTNQAFRFMEQVPQKGDRVGSYVVVIAPHVLAEMALHKKPASEMEKLSRLDVLLGLEPPEAVEIFASLTPEKMRGFTPFRSKEKSVQIVGGVIRALVSGNTAWADRAKKQNLEFCERMVANYSQLRAKLSSNGIAKTPKFNTINEATELSSFQELVVSSVTNGGCRKTVLSSPDQLYRAAMENQYLARFFKAVLYSILSWTRAWADQAHNSNASPTRDDWTDITLLLYAGAGDVIVTEDRKLRQAIAMIEPEGRVQSKSVKEFFP